MSNLLPNIFRLFLKIWVYFQDCQKLKFPNKLENMRKAKSLKFFEKKSFGFEKKNSAPIPKLDLGFCSLYRKLVLVIHQLVYFTNTQYLLQIGRKGQYHIGKEAESQTDTNNLQVPPTILSSFPVWIFLLPELHRSQTSHCTPSSSISKSQCLSVVVESSGRNHMWSFKGN